MDGAGRALPANTTSPRLSEMCRTSITAWPGAGRGSAAVPSLRDPGAPGSTTAARCCGRRSNYRSWHGHLRGLIGEARPDLDAGFLAHTLLAVFDGDLIRHMTPPGDPRRFTRSVQQMATALLDGAARP
ncbi:hypothetical protein B0I32_101725 [Nonomuraea fuscirosea]|uniref:TetR family transcriptional regulator n=1 Tax=Nonomuraea fuscirosea TaxID=1291556 RepID=A0A2T0NCG0_9ACTN|nr:hypothetical protein [Nonomuraea fuscirosea]PRX70630.1 hypothetical protein B0I32_101725 [Nonomuraea fuscirosea]